MSGLLMGKDMRLLDYLEEMNVSIEFVDKGRFVKAILDDRHPVPFPEPPARTTLKEGASFLFGRERELEILEELFENAVKSGKPKLSYIQGKQGVGKSSLVSWFVQTKKKESPNSIFLVPIETTTDGGAYEFRHFYSNCFETLFQSKAIHAIGSRLFVKILELMEKNLTKNEFETILARLKLTSNDYLDLKREPSHALELANRNQTFLNQLTRSFEEQFHSIYPELPTMNFDFIITIWYSMFKNPETFRAIRALQGKGEFENFKIEHEHNAQNVFRDFIEILDWVFPSSVILIVMDHLEAGIANPDKVYNNLYSFLLSFRNMKKVAIILSGTYDAFHSIEEVWKDDMNQQITSWADKFFIGLNPLDANVVIQIVSKYLQDYWSNFSLTAPSHNPLFPFSNDAVDYIYRFTRTDLRRTLELLHGLFRSYRATNQVIELKGLFDAFKMFRKKQGYVALSIDEARLLKNKMMSSTIQDHSRSKKLEQQMFRLLKAFSKQSSHISNVMHEPKLGLLKPDIYFEVGDSLQETRRVAIEIKLYRVSRVIPSNELKKTHDLLRTGKIDYLIWYSNKPLDLMKFKLEPQLKERIGLVRELTQNELGYAALIFFHDQLFDELPTDLIPELFMHAGIDIQQIRNMALQLPPNKGIRQPSEPLVSVQTFLEENNDEVEEWSEILDVDNEQERLKKSIQKQIRKKSSQTRVYVTTILKMLKKEGFDLIRDYGEDQAFNMVLNTARDMGFRVTPKQIQFQ